MKHLIFFLMIAFFSNAYSAENLQCPSINDPASKGWEKGQLIPTSSSNFASLFTGHPKNRAEITPDDLESGDPTKNTWTVEKSQHPLWIQCLYKDSKTYFTRELPKSTKYCKVIFDSKKDQWGVNCR